MNSASQSVNRLRDALQNLDHCAGQIKWQYDYLRPRLLLEKSHPSDDEIEAACEADEPTGHIDVKLSNGLTATTKPFEHWLRESRIEVERFAKAVAEVRSAVAELPADAMDDKNLPLVQRWSSVFRRELNEVVQWFAHFLPNPLTMPKKPLVRQWTQACKRNAMPPDWLNSVRHLLRFDSQLHSIWQGYRAEEERQEELRRLLNAESEQNATPQAAMKRKTRGRPLETDLKKDQRLAEAWKTGQYKTYSDLAREENTTRKAIKDAIDRHRQRNNRRTK